MRRGRTGPRTICAEASARARAHAAAPKVAPARVPILRVPEAAAELHGVPPVPQGSVLNVTPIVGPSFPGDSSAFWWLTREAAIRVFRVPHGPDAQRTIAVRDGGCPPDAPGLVWSFNRPLALNALDQLVGDALQGVPHRVVTDERGTTALYLLVWADAAPTLERDLAAHVLVRH